MVAAADRIQVYWVWNKNGNSRGDHKMETSHNLCFKTAQPGFYSSGLLALVLKLVQVFLGVNSVIGAPCRSSVVAPHQELKNSCLVNPGRVDERVGSPGLGENMKVSVHSPPVPPPHVLPPCASTCTPNLAESREDTYFAILRRIGT